MLDAYLSVTSLSFNSNSRACLDETFSTTGLFCFLATGLATTFSTISSATGASEVFALATCFFYFFGALALGSLGSFTVLASFASFSSLPFFKKESSLIGRLVILTLESVIVTILFIWKKDLILVVGWERKT